MKIFLLYNGKRIAKKRKTNVKKRTLNPEFNETFVFDLPYSQEELKNVELNFIVFDWDRLSKNEVTYIQGVLALCNFWAWEKLALAKYLPNALFGLFISLLQCFWLMHFWGYLLHYYDLFWLFSAKKSQ